MAITLEEVVQTIINVVRDKEELLNRIKVLEQTIQDDLCNSVRKPDDAKGK